MVVTSVCTMTNNNEQRTMNCSKQTQSNPIANQPPHFSKFLSKTPIFLIFYPFSSPFSFVFCRLSSLVYRLSSFFRLLFSVFRLLIFPLFLIYFFPPSARPKFPLPDLNLAPFMGRAKARCSLSKNRGKIMLRLYDSCFNKQPGFAEDRCLFVVHSS